ncbi:MAG: sulfatase [Pseudomonadota bacterium]|nr:sulfatase [Pseudomonadota bacterium]
MLPLSLLLVPLACTGPADAPVGVADPAPGPRPNFVVIDIDSMRADRMPLSRDGAVVTPTLARLAREGVVFMQAYSQSGWTLPALLSLLSGRYPQGVSAGPTGRVTLELPERSLPEILALYGYDTVGMWGSTLPSNDPSILGAFSRKLEASLDTPDPLNDPIVAYLDGKPAEPFLLYLHAIDLNSVPAYVPDAALHRWTDPHPHKATSQLQDLFWELHATLGPDLATTHTTSHYDGVLSWYDAGLGRVLDTLDRTGLASNTVVIFTSEHGQELGERGTIGHHGSQYDTVLHVPLVVRDPALPGGRVVTSTVESIDLAPTVLARAGIPVDRQMDGRSWLPLLGSAPAAWPPREVYSYSAREALSVRTDRWKLAIHAKTCPPTTDGAPRTCGELYDLVADPAETANVGDANPAVRADLTAKLEAWGQARIRDGTAPEEDPRLVAALKSGGYWGMVVRAEDLPRIQPGDAPPLDGNLIPAGAPRPGEKLVPPSPDAWRKAAPPPSSAAIETPEERRARRRAQEGE